MTDETEAGQPVLVTQKAHTMIIEVLAGWGIEPSSTTPEQLTIATTEALCRAIKQNERLLNLLRDCNTESISWLDARDAALDQNK
jgi:hypothetical protein